MPIVPPSAERVDNPWLRTVYFAAPVTTYQTPRYERLRQIVTAQYPDALLIPARDLYLDNADWRRRWPQYVPFFDELVFIHDGAGYIGRGTHQEIEDMRAWGKPVQLLDDWGRLHPFTAIKLSLLRGGSDWQRYARVTVPKPSPA